MKIASSCEASSYFKPMISTKVEEVWIAALNSQLDLIHAEMIFRGTVDQCTFHPREVLQVLCSHRASSFILAHSHPGGSPLPSKEDHKVTKNLRKLSELMMIPIQDHIIFCEDAYFSFADHGLLRKKATVSPRSKADPTEF